MGATSIRTRPKLTLCDGVGACVSVILCSAFGLLAGPSDAQTIGRNREVVIAVVRDGPPAAPDIVPLVEAELAAHLPHGSRYRFQTSDAGWDRSRVEAVLGAALADRTVDLVLVDGLLTTLAAARTGYELVKPVLSISLQRSDLVRLPGDPTATGKPNFAYTTLPHRALDDLKTFRDLFGFETLHVVVDVRTHDTLPGFRDHMLQLERELSLKISVITADDDPDAVADQLTGAEAVYLTDTPRLKQTERRRLLERLTAADIPSFSLGGHPDVELGALVARLPDITRQHVRRVALNLASLVRGGSTADLPRILSVEPELLINARTASSIGWSPSLEIRISTRLLHEETLGLARAGPLALADALGRAAAHNRALAVKDAEVAGVRHDQRRARSVLLPQAGLNLLYHRVDSDLRDQFAGLIPADATIASIKIRQLVFGDRAWSGYRASKIRVDAIELEREAERLDVVAAAGRSFLGLALAQARYRVRIDDLRLTESFLALARTRRDVGYSGIDEIYRFEAALAEARGALYAATAEIEAARIGLNQALGEEQQKRWLLQPIEVDAEVFRLLDGRLDPYLDDLGELDRLRDYLVTLGVAQAPEVQALVKALEATDLTLGMLTRRWYVPEVFAELEYRNQLGGSGDLPSPNDNFYTFQLGFAYPLFEGGGRAADIDKGKAEELALQNRLELVRELVEQRIRTAERATESSFPRIRFARQAAEAANKNLGIVRDKYAEGLVNVTDLLSAQNQKLTAEELATAASYRYLLDLVELQRAISWFEDEHTASERERLADAIGVFVAREQP